MKNISFIIPLHNEEKRIEKTFEALTRVKLPRGVKLSEAILVDNGSTDNTFTKIGNLVQYYSALNVSVISYKRKLTKKEAVAYGKHASQADFNLVLSPTLSNLNEKLIRLDLRMPLRQRVWSFLKQNINL